MSERVTIVGLVILLIVGGLGAMVLIKSITLSVTIKNGSDHLMKAIETNDADHVIWVYGMTMELQGSPVKQLKNYNLIIFTRNSRNGIQLALKNKEDFEQILAFFAHRFPNAQFGHSEEIRNRVKEEHNIIGGRY